MPLYGEAKKEYQRNWMRERRNAWFKDKVCRSCGSPDNLELNHIDPATKITHNVWSWTASRRLEELSKCEALCTGCHKDVTRTQSTKPVRHGTYNGYKKGCRLGCCRDMCKEYWREYRIKKRA